MDEAPAAPASNSTAAAAVADSESSKATGAAGVSANTVKLIIKASNQQFDDHIIESNLLWTVKRLKTQLSLVYPSKPAVDDQKLIYSGQLLKDKLLLKDVIRSYKDVYTQNHIFHLVCMPKNPPPVTKSSTTYNQKPNRIPPAAATSMSALEGLRQRSVAAAAASSLPQTQQTMPQNNEGQQQYYQWPNFMQHPTSQNIPMMPAHGNMPQCPYYDPNMAAYGMGGQYNIQAMAAHQAAMYNWMQHVYAQYMEQCMRSFQNLPASSSNNVGITANNLPPNTQIPFFPNLYTAVGAAANPVISPIATPPYPSAAATLAANAAAVSAQETQAPPAAPAPQEQPAPQPAARFPNIAQEEGDNRDWLDSFFSLMRVAIFLCILYFNSSPLRCLMVVCIAGGIYLYHIGVLRLRTERNNNNINRNNNADADQIRQGVQQVQQAQAAQQQHENGEEVADGSAPGEQDATNNDAADNTVAAEGAVAAAVAEEPGNSVSVISFVRTFVVTFFTSLLPEAPAAL